MYKQNKVGFVNFMQNFLESQNNEQRFFINPHLQNQNYQLQHQQQVVQDYLSIQTPYRGLLVYHSIGSGKTLTAISVIHSLEQYKKVFILTKKSLQTTFKQEIYKFDKLHELKWKQRTTHQSCSHSKRSKMDSAGCHSDVQISAPPQILEHSKNVPCYSSEGPGQKWTIDENGTFYKYLSEDEQLEIKQQFINDLDDKYQFISYNGIRKQVINTFNFDNSLIIIDEAHNFISQSISDSQDKTGLQLYIKILYSVNIKILLLTGTPIVNQPLELAYLANLLQGPTIYYKIPYRQQSYQVISTNKHVNYYEQIVDKTTNKKYIVFILNPPCFVNTDTQRISFNPDIKFGECDDTHNIYAFQTIQKAISNFDIKKLIQTPTFPFPFDSQKFTQYFGSLKEGELHNLDSIKRRLFGIISYYGKIDETIMPVMKKEYLKVEMSTIQFSKYVEYRTMERFYEKKKNMREHLESRSPFQDFSLFKSFSRITSDFIFPLNMERMFQSEAKKLGYNKQERYEALQLAVKKLDEQKNLYLSMEQLPLYSPKYYKILQHLLDKDNIGSHLIYTFYKQVEGINIIKMILQVNGFAELKVKKDFYTGQYALDLPKEDIGKPLYIDFNSNTDQLLIDIFNNNLKEIQQNIKTQLVSIYKNKILQHQDIMNEQNKTIDETFNMLGDIVKVMLITKSGSEGLNLRNVRFVHLTEPDWNQQVQNQVIGRAVRQRSHYDLPLRLRNVKAIIYICVLTQQQINSNQQIKVLDKGLSTDEELLRISNNKDNITQQILEIFKECSIDCYTIKNYNPYQKCYRFSPDFNQDKLIYSQNIDQDIQQQRKLILVEFPILYDQKTPKIERDNAPSPKFQVSSPSPRAPGVVSKKQRFYLDPTNNSIFDFESQQEVGQFLNHKIIITNVDFIIDKLTTLGQQDKFIFDNNYQILINKDSNQKFRTYQYIYGIKQQI